MKSTIETKPTPTMAETIQAAILGAPSYPAMKEAKAKLAELAQRKDALEADVRRLRARIVESKTESRLADKARALLTGGRAEDSRSDLSAALSELQTADEALNQLGPKIDAMRGKLTFEVVGAVRPFRQALVDRIATALDDLRQAAREDDKFREVMIGGGLDGRLVPCISLASVPAAGSGADTDWTNARRQEGFTV